MSKKVRSRKLVRKRNTSRRKGSLKKSKKVRSRNFLRKRNTFRRKGSLKKSTRRKMMKGGEYIGGGPRHADMAVDESVELEAPDEEYAADEEYADEEETAAADTEADTIVWEVRRGLRGPDGSFATGEIQAVARPIDAYPSQNGTVREVGATFQNQFGQQIALAAQIQAQAEVVTYTYTFTDVDPATRQQKPAVIGFSNVTWHDPQLSQQLEGRESLPDIVGKTIYFDNIMKNLTVIAEQLSKEFVQQIVDARLRTNPEYRLQPHEAAPYVFS